MPVLISILMITSIVVTAYAQTDSLKTQPSDTVIKQDSTIFEIQVLGNRVTKQSVFDAYLTFTTGEKYDSAEVAASQVALNKTNLFDKISIFPQFRPQGARVYVIVRESMYFNPLDEVGGQLQPSLYGDSHYWLQMRLGVSYNNFRGVMETIRLRTEFWESRGIGLSWSKQFLPSKCFFGTGVDYGDRPDLIKDWRYKGMNVPLSLGKNIQTDYKLYTILNGTYFNAYYQKPKNANIDSLPIREWGLPLTIGFLADKRSRRWDTDNGWFDRVSFTTNVLYPEDRNRYIQLDNDARWYTPGIFVEHKVAIRMQTTFRTADGGEFHNVRAGGEYNLRGYSKDVFGGACSANNRVVGTVEYRFPMFSTPPIDLPVLSGLHDQMKQFYYRFDGAFFIDGGYLWHDILDPQGGSESGEGIGCGIRIMAPTMKRCGCFDFGWPFKVYRYGVYRPLSWIPLWALYVDLTF